MEKKIRPGEFNSLRPSNSLEFKMKFQYSSIDSTIFVIHISFPFAPTPAAWFKNSRETHYATFNCIYTISQLPYLRNGYIVVLVMKTFFIFRGK